MIFSSIEFLVFFSAVLLSVMLIKSNTVKKTILLCASYYFYAYWDFRFVLLMFIISGVNYYVGLKIEVGKHKKKWLTIGIIFNLVILGFFKYYNFFMDSFNATFGVNWPLLKIILPVGISFITFEVISYIIDIYRGTNKSAKTFWDLALLVAFFPHLVAGPILKPSQFLGQLNNDIIVRWSNIEQGSQIFLMGLVKKLLIADRLALFVDPVFKNPALYSSETIWLAVIAYAIQIYCDFSGYTDMAIGSAKCIGFEIPQNFNMPYISRSITEFWRRWHISLSAWLRDYLYIPLGGNRKGEVRQYINLIIVMLLGGLWHGASWNFVVWGGIHGVGLAIHKLYNKFIPAPTGIAYNFLSWLTTFMFVCFAWIFFRASDFAIAWQIISKMFYVTTPQGINWHATSLLITIPFIMVCHYLRIKLQNHYLPLTSFKGLVVIFFVIFGLLFLAPQNSSPFIYFQF